MEHSGNDFLGKLIVVSKQHHCNLNYGVLSYVFMEVRMITGVRWFSSKDCIGVVQVVQSYQEEQYLKTGKADFKYYIGTAFGDNEKSDMQYIADWGSTFPKNVGDLMFNEMVYE